MRRSIQIVGAVAVASVLLSGVLLSASDAPERASCVSRAPQFDRAGPGYEIIDMFRGEAWATRDWTPEAYDAFSPPLSWSLWFKNDPRVGIADGARFARSPGCREDGRFSYMSAFGRSFVLVARPRSIIAGGETDGAIRGAMVEKHHLLRYAAGRSVRVLRNPAGQLFIAVSRPLRPAASAARPPAGWSLDERLLTEDLKVDLAGEVTVLRLTDGVSYQGPLSGAAARLWADAGPAR